jgi:uroporphyrinogen-III synthase
MTEPLKGRRIALAEARELDLLAGMLERAGAHAVRCPLVAILDAPDSAPVEAWIRRSIAGGFDDVILYTGEGVRRLLGFADRAGLRRDFVAALGRMRKITRGPKPVRALREIGLVSDLVAEQPTTTGIIATLESEALNGRTIGVQLYGQEPNAALLAFLEGRGATVDTVAPYIYASAAEDERVVTLIRDMAAGGIDAIAFTSSPQVQRLTQVADKAGLAAALKDGFGQTKVAAIGPVVAKELERFGIRHDATVEPPYAMKPLVTAIARLFERTPAR